jgi:hypothetical protein
VAGLEVAQSAFAADIVAQAAAARTDGGAQGFLDRRDQALQAGERDAACHGAWVDAGQVQAFRGIDVADADDDAGIHDGRLDGRAASRHD